MIEFAHQNFLPPWKVFGGSKTLWYIRFEAERDAMVKKQHKREAETKSRELAAKG